MSSEKYTAEDLDRALLRDRQRLHRLWKSATVNGSFDGTLEPGAALIDLLSSSLAAVEKRRQQCPAIRFDQDLPILAHGDSIIETIRDHPVVVISGETGSGKSTQLPKLCLAAGFGFRGLIGHTQPRRIAARSIATRLAEELHQPLGESVGFKIRFADKTSDTTLIKLMTDGMLLAETQGDRYLNEYEVLIIDEAHERSLNIDFLLGFLKQLLPKRPDLRVIITSATIDAERFSEHFETYGQPAPVIAVSGRNFPVEVRYRPLIDHQGDEIPEIDGIVTAVHELAAIDDGDVLIFLPTERDIRETAHRLRKEQFRGGATEVLPLYARLSAAEQNKVFKETGARRLVLATNVAESSLTVPGIRYVIDTGTARISRYSPRIKVQRLPIEAVSRASADQRKGRCGRVAPGVCVRLYDEADYWNRPEFTTPEIQRTNLAAVILRAKTLRLGPVEQFPFLDSPLPESIRDGYRTLYELGAIDEDQRLLPLGRRLSRYPVDPRIARIVLAGHEFGCLADILIIAAALEIQDPRDRPPDKQQQADQQHAKFADEKSDFMALLNIWDFFSRQKENLSKSALRRSCSAHFLSYKRLWEWTEVRRQLAQLAASDRIRPGQRKNNHQHIHQALLCGLLSGVGYRASEYEYTGAGGVKFHLWPGSSVFHQRPSWILTAELVETRKRYGRIVAEINPKWIEPLAEHVVKRSYDSPHWHQKSGRVMAWESVTLFGMPIVKRRRVPYGPIQPEVASEVFIREGLAKQQLDCSDRFYQQNERTIEECIKLAAKTRRSDYLVDEFTLYQFYNSRLPADVYDLATMRKWLKADAEHRRRIRMTLRDLLPEEPQAQPDSYPDELKIGPLAIPIEYAFSPGEESDGASITVPQDALAQLDTTRAAWGIPGQLEERIVAMIRSLPKSLRVGLIPAPDTGRSVAKAIEFGKGDFFRVVTKALTRIGGERITAGDFRWDKIPAHLSVNIRVVDDQGQLVGQGRDLSELRSQLGIAAAVEMQPQPDTSWHRDDVTTWDFGDLPKSVTVRQNEMELLAFPTVIDAGNSVQLRLFNSAARSRQTCRGGIRRLYALTQRKALRSQISWLPQWDQVCVWSAAILTQEQLRTEVRDLLADRAFFQPGEKLPRSEQAFAERLTNAAERIGLATGEIAKLLPKLFENFHLARLACEAAANSHWQYAIEDVENQLAAMFSAGFLLESPWMWLTEYPRYLRGIAYRLERLSAGSRAKDQQATAEIQAYWQRYQQQAADDEIDQTFNAELVTFRWMIEEYRISVFAQPLGTMVSVSAQRLEKQWTKVKQGESSEAPPRRH